MALGLDGNTSGTNNSTATSIATLSTTKTNDILIAAGTSRILNHNITAVSSTNTTGWANLIDATFGNPSLSVWTGKAASILTNESITITWDTNAVNWDWVVFAVSGANFANPFDTDASLPATTNGHASGTPSQTSVSTSNPNDFIFAIVGSTESSKTFTQGAGFTIINTPSQNNISAADEYQIVSATQSNISVPFGNSTTGTWSMAVHAIVQAAVPTIGTIQGSMTLTGSRMRF